MELFPVRDVSGFAEVLWTFRHWRRKLVSRRWIRARGIVEGYEFLKSGRANGWFVVFYSYSFNGTHYAGEWRRGAFLGWSPDFLTDWTTSRLPRGTVIRVRVDPER